MFALFAVISIAGCSDALLKNDLQDASSTSDVNNEDTSNADSPAVDYSNTEPDTSESFMYGDDEVLGIYANETNKGNTKSTDYISICSDGKGVFSFNNVSHDISWDIDRQSFIAVLDDGSSIVGRFSPGEISLRNYGTFILIRED